MSPPANESRPAEPGRDARLLGAVAPAVLVVFALAQVVLAYTHRLTPWKGGGFGMFSTVDELKRRSLRAWLLNDGEAVPVDLARLRLPRDLVSQAEAFPSERRLRWVAARIQREKWTLPAAPALPPSSPAAAAAAAPPPRAIPATAGAAVLETDGVRVEVWGARIDDPASPRKMTWVQLARREWPMSPGGEK